jgi:hypothetical protein
MTPKQTSTRDIAHLLRRAGFGPSQAELDTYTPLGFERAVDRLIAGLAEKPPADPAGFSVFAPGAANAAWLERMRTSATPLAEKLTLFWHGHFATSVARSRIEADMAPCRPSVRWCRTVSDLVVSVSRDPAMIRWLDGNSTARRLNRTMRAS